MDQESKMKNLRNDEGYITEELEFEQNTAMITRVIATNYIEENVDPYLEEKLKSWDEKERDEKKRTITELYLDMTENFFSLNI